MAPKNFTNLEKTTCIDKVHKPVMMAKLRIKFTISFKKSKNCIQEYFKDISDLFNAYNVTEITDMRRNKTTSQ